jgi:hypothetical protein
MEEIFTYFGLRLESTKDRGRILIADRDIYEGEIIYNEIPLSYIKVDESECSICTRPSCSRCENCGKSWCSDTECLENDIFHKKECEFLTCVEEIASMCDVDPNLLKLIIRTAFSLKDKSPAKVKDGTFIKPCSMMIKNLVSHIKLMDPDWVNSTLMAIEKLREINTLGISRDSLLRIAGIINSNSHKIGSLNSVGMFAFSSLINHSCLPNCIFTDMKHRGQFPALSIKALRNISKGEEVTTSYIDILQITEERRIKLLKTKNFWCNCERCSLSPKNCESFVCCDCGMSIDNSSSCHEGITSEQVNMVSDDFERKCISAFQWFTSGSPVISFAVQELNSLLNYRHKEFKLRPHILHQKIIEALIALINCYNLVGNYDDALKNCIILLDKFSQLEDITEIPRNWPDVNDMLYLTAEIMGESIKDAQTQGKEVSHQLSTLRLRALNYAEECLKRRKVCLNDGNELLEATCTLIQNLRNLN